MKNSISSVKNPIMSSYSHEDEGYYENKSSDIEITKNLAVQIN